MFEFRKIQRTPTGTFFICLPRPWAEQQGLKKGNLMALKETTDGQLLLNPKHQTESIPKSTSLNAGPLLKRDIIGRYLLGFDIISIKAKERVDFDIRTAVKSTTSSLVGLEIVEENYSQIVLQCLLEPSSFPPEKILCRNYAIVAGMSKDIVNAFIHGDLQLAKSVAARDIESNRLYFLLVRILRTVIQNPSLSEKLGVSPIECLDYRLAANLIEGMGDASVRIAAKVLELNGAKPNENLGKLFLDLQAICYKSHENALKAFLAKDVVLAENVRGAQIGIETKSAAIENLAKGTLLDSISQVIAVVSLLRQIYENSVDLADLVA